jgi:predicted dehydrogenase
MARKVRVGVMGLGIGQSHIANYKGVDAAEVVAFCDKDAAWLAHMQKQHGAVRGYTNYRQMLKDAEIDAVSVCLPTYLHAEATIASLKAGKHVLCEKPMAVNGREAQAMAAAARASKKVLAISQNRRFERSSQYLKGCMEKGQFGDVYFVRVGWQRPMGMFPVPDAERATGRYSRNWFNEKAKGGGVLRDLGSHMLDLTMWLLDFPKVRQVVSANYCLFTPAIAARTGEKADAEDFGSGTVLLENGASLQLEVNFGAHIEKESVFLEIYGRRGGASLRDGVMKTFTEDGGAYTATTVQNYLSPGGTTQGDFVDAVLNRRKPLVTPDQGVRIIQLLDSLYAGGIRYGIKV